MWMGLIGSVFGRVCHCPYRPGGGGPWARGADAHGPTSPMATNRTTRSEAPVARTPRNVEPSTLRIASPGSGRALRVEQTIASRHATYGPGCAPHKLRN